MDAFFPRIGHLISKRDFPWHPHVTSPSGLAPKNEYFGWIHRPFSSTFSSVTNNRSRIKIFIMNDNGFRQKRGGGDSGQPSCFFFIMSMKCFLASGSISLPYFIAGMFSSDFPDFSPQISFSRREKSPVLFVTTL